MNNLHNWHVVQHYIAECNYRAAKRNNAEHWLVVEGWNLLAVVSAKRVSKEIDSITATGREPATAVRS